MGAFARARRLPVAGVVGAGACGLLAGDLAVAITVTSVGAGWCHVALAVRAYFMVLQGAVVTGR